MRPTGKSLEKKAPQSKSKQRSLSPAANLATADSSSTRLHRAVELGNFNFPTSMTIVKIKAPKRPQYISESIEVNAVWSDKFDTALQIIGPKHNVPTLLIAQVTANNKAFQLVMSYETTIGKWAESWRLVKLGLVNASPESTAPIEFPAQPKFEEMVPAVGPYILAPHIQAANILLTDPTLTETERMDLGLVVAQGKPVEPDAKKRTKADEFNYPYFKVKTVNGMVNIQLTHGSNFYGKAALFQKDVDGTGNFENIVSLVGTKYEDPIMLPAGQLNAAWSYRAIYVSGNSTISDWSPAQTIAVTAEPSPFNTANKAAKLADATAAIAAKTNGVETLSLV